MPFSVPPPLPPGAGLQGGSGGKKCWRPGPGFLPGKGKTPRARSTFSPGQKAFHALGEPYRPAPQPNPQARGPTGLRGTGFPLPLPHPKWTPAVPCVPLEPCPSCVHCTLTIGLCDPEHHAVCLHPTPAPARASLHPLPSQHPAGASEEVLWAPQGYRTSTGHTHPGRGQPESGSHRVPPCPRYPATGQLHHCNCSNRPGCSPSP